MRRTRSVLIAILVCLFAATTARAQTPVPEGWVVLPVDEYRALRARANPDPPPPAHSPVDAALTRIEYDVRVDPATSSGTGPDTLTGRALLTVDVVRDGWVKVPIPAGLLVRDAKVDGQAVPLVEGPPPHVLLSRAGRYVLSLDFALPLAAASGAESFSLPASPAALSRVVLTLPRGGVDLAVTGGFVSSRSETPTESTWTALGRVNQSLSFSWKRRTDDRRAEQPLKLRARTASVIGLGEEVSTMTSTVRIEVLQGLAREISLAVPAGVTVNQVNGATIADWESSNGQLKVRLLDPVSTELSFVVIAETRLPADGDITIPLVRIPTAERETGGIAVSVLGAGEIEQHQIRGLELGDVADVGDVTTGRESPSMVAFRLRPIAGADPRSLQVSVKRYTPQAVLIANVEEARYRALAAEDGLFLVDAHYAVRNNQRSFLKVTLPPRATIWSASVAGKPVRPGVAEGDAVLLALEKGRAGEDAPTFVVRLTYLQPVDTWANQSQSRLQLPALDLPVSRTGLELHHSPRFRVELQPGSFRLETDPGVFAEGLRAMGAGAGMSGGIQYGAAVEGGYVGGVAGGAIGAPPPPPMAMAEPARVQDANGQMRELINRYRNEGGGRTVRGALPIDVAFPSIGPSMFMASELTAEGQAPSIDLMIRKIK